MVVENDIRPRPTNGVSRNNIMELLKRTLPILTRFRKLIIMSGLFGLVLGLVYGINREARYTASTELIVYNSGIQVFQQDIIVVPAPVDATLVQNQIEIILSRRVLLNASLKSDNIDMQPNAPGAFNSIFPDWIRSFKSSGVQASLISKYESLKRRVEVKRLGTSHAIEIRAIGTTPAAADQFCRGVVNSYLKEQEEANEGATKASAAWLRDRIKSVGPSARVISECAAPTRKDNWQFYVYAILGSIFGALLCSLIIFMVIIVGWLRADFAKFLA